MWNTNIDDTVIRPIAKKAVDMYADKVLEQDPQRMEVEIDGYKVRMLRNPILHNPIVTEIIAPESKGARYMINVNVGIPSGDETRWFVGIYYKFEEDRGWVEKDSLKKLTTY